MKVYLSSTFQDLERHRSAAYAAMRKLQIEVIAMEDYVARDERTAAACLADVRSSNLYVGLFAFRYGHVPEIDNPEGKSITELEYREARRHNIPCLVFMVPDDASWPRNFDDHLSGDGERGTRIDALRQELGTFIAGRFTTPTSLQLEVAAAVGKRLQGLGQAPPASPSTESPVPHPRQLSVDVLLLHSPADADTAAAIVDLLRIGGYAVLPRGQALLATTPAELQELDRQATMARSACVLLSRSALTMLEEDPARARRVLDIVGDRTGKLLAVTPDPELEPAAEWGFHEIGRTRPESTIPPHEQLALSIKRAIGSASRLADGPLIGLPVVSVAMTSSEFATFVEAPPEPVAALVEEMGRTQAALSDRYAASRWNWRPFAGSPETIGQILDAAVAHENATPHVLRGRTIALQRYALDGVEDFALNSQYDHIARTGCLVVVDELSVFHDHVRFLLETSPFLAGPQVAFVTVAPRDPLEGSPGQLVEAELTNRLQGAARRFGEGLDPLCELGIPERRRLHRWFHGNLARTLDALRDARSDADKLRSFADEVGQIPDPHMARVIAGESRLS